MPHSRGLVLFAVVTLASTLVVGEVADHGLRCVPQTSTLPDLPGKPGVRDFQYAQQNKVIGSESTRSGKKVTVLYGDVLCAPADVLVSSAKRRIEDSVNSKVSGLAKVFLALTGGDENYVKSFKDDAARVNPEDPSAAIFDKDHVLTSPPGLLEDRVNVDKDLNEAEALPVKDIVTVQGPRNLENDPDGNECGKHYPIGHVYTIVWNALQEASKKPNVKSVGLPVFGTNKKGCDECSAMGYTIMAADDFLEHAKSSLEEVQITLYRDPNSKNQYGDKEIKFFERFLKDAVSHNKDDPQGRTFECPKDAQSEESLLELREFRDKNHVPAPSSDSHTTKGEAAAIPDDESGGVELSSQARKRQCDPSERVAKDWMEALDQFTNKLVELSDKAYADQTKELDGTDVQSLKQALQDLGSKSPDADNQPDQVKEAWAAAILKMKETLNDVDGGVKHEHIQAVAGHYMSVVSEQLGVVEANDEL